MSALTQKLIEGKTVHPLNNPFDGEFVPVLSKGKEPAWVDEVRALLKGSLPSLNSQSPGGLLVVRRSSRTFVITFGHAWQKLENDWLESDFGRRVALNSINRNNVIELRAEQVFARWHVASERAPRASSVKEFGVEFDRDLVAAVEGVPNSKSLGLTVRGGTNLRLTLPISMLNSILDEVLLLFQSDKYKKEWPEIDNLSPVRDQALVAQLDGQLDTELKSGVAQKKIVLFTPAHRRDELVVVDSYVFGRMSKSPQTSPYLMFSSWANYLKKKELTVSVTAARNSPVHLLDENKQSLKTWTVYDCFGYETSVANKPFVLSSGTWYEVVPDFLSRIDGTLKEIPTTKSPLPAWDQKEDEGAYNLRCSKLQNWLHFDAKNIMFGGGQSKFEFCDVADRSVASFACTTT